jgi:hypothetical protein
MPESDKTRRQRELDRLALEVLAGRHTGSESWTRWTDWMELIKARRGDRGLGNTTVSECTKRLLDQGRIRRSPQIAKNRFYQAMFPPGSSSGVVSSKGENGGSDHDPVTPASDKATQALAFLLNRKSPGGV